MDFQSIVVYFRKNELDNDIAIYSIDEWISRGEEYLTDADFVITSEGSLNFIMNYGNPDELYDLVRSFGYIMQMGHSWSYGFYYDDEIDNTSLPKELSYSDKLKDKRWQEKRKIVRENANYKCQDCHSTINLEVHHCYYKYGLEPWQYPLDSLRCLCAVCHKRRDKVEMEVRAKMAELSTDELGVLSKIINGGMDYYPEHKVIELIKYLDIDIENVIHEMKKNNIL